MANRVERSLDSRRDLALIFDHLYQSYQSFGDDPGEAWDRAAKRIRAIEDDMMSLGKGPSQGTLRPELLNDLRSVTKDRTVFYFRPDGEREAVQILAVFYGGQDHQREMLKRLLGER